MNKLQSLAGLQAHTSQAEKVVSAVGGFLSVLLMSLISYKFTGLQGALAVVPSMGAAVVLLYAVPHGPLSQPWALFMGNGAGAVIGVTVAQWVPDILLASALAVGLAIAAMHLLRCIHPPGGATALAAVIGGEQIHALGYGYVLVPTLLNCLVIFAVAMLFNNFFPWRRYPAGLMRFISTAIPPRKPHEMRAEHIEQALEELDVVIDASVEQLQSIFSRSMEIAHPEDPNQIDPELGGVYTNDKPGSQWSVRQIIDYYGHADADKDMVIYKVLDGHGKNITGSCTRREFSAWAKRQLMPVRK